MDLDPDSETGGQAGVTDPGPSRKNESAIYIETIRELEKAPVTPRITEQHTVVHDRSSRRRGAY